jgi:hypothetical protein
MSIVIVDDRRGAGIPMPANLDAHPRISDEILHVAALPAMFGDQPEDIAVESIAHWRQSEPPTTSSNGLKQRERAGAIPSRNATRNIGAK